MKLVSNYASPSDVPVPDVPDVTKRLAPARLRRAVANSQTGYVRTGDGEQDTLLVVFMTMHRAIGIHFETLYNVAKATKQDLLFIDDRGRDFLTRGIRFWKLTMQDSASAIVNFAAAHGKSKINTIGHSSGATTCLTYSTLMPVQRCVVFNPFTSFENIELVPDSIAEGFLGRIRDNIRTDLVNDERLSEGDGYYTQMRNWILSSQYETDYQVFYSDDFEMNAAHSESLAGLPNVHLHKMKYDDHDLPHFLHLNKRLDRVLLRGFGAGKKKKKKNQAVTATQEPDADTPST
ncbi:MAG: hypothetical protein Kilf2KO_25570 [Rhodospirillales bacterium]